MNEQFRPVPTALRVMPKPHDVPPPPSANQPQSFVHHKCTASPVALFFSMLVTAALLSLLLLMSGIADRVPSAMNTLVVVSITQTLVEKERPPEELEEEPVDQPEVTADSPEEASPSSSALTTAPASALADIPLPETPLAPIKLPEMPITGEEPTALAGANSNGDQSQGALGFGGQGGNGIAGNGSGGTGTGSGTGNRLIASWAPDMDFSVLAYFYPRDALNAKIEGTALLSCFVPRFNEIRECKLIKESPAGHGFGQAALQAKRSFRVRLHNQAGRRVYNEWVKIRSHFVLPEAEGGAAQAKNVVSIVAEEP